MEIEENTQNLRKLSVKRINDIVQSPSTIEDMASCDGILAIARTDGIELRDIQTYSVLVKIPGVKEIDTKRIFITKRKLESNYEEEEDVDETNNEKVGSYSLINFHKNYRIFTTGLCSFLVEWSILKQQPSQFYSCSGNPIWDACFSKVNTDSIYLGCNDGVIRVINTRNKFYLSRQFHNTTSPITSISSFKLKNMKKEIVCSGHLNGSINKWDEGIVEKTFGNKAYSFNKNPKRKNKVEIEEDNEDEDEIVIQDTTQNAIWKLCYINEKYLASGNQEGELQIWDIEYGVLFQRYKEHEGDILAIEFSNKYNCLYFTGCDSLVVCLKYSKNDLSFQCKLRPQSHDINSLLLIESNNSNILLSGGVTTDLCLIKLDKGRFLESFGKKQTAISKIYNLFIIRN